MKLQQLRYLLAIVDNGLNITAAAEKLYTSQPGVSKQLKLLEEELGLQLFTRRGKSLVEITPAGREVVGRARVVMQEVENIRRLASNLHGEQTGTLAIGTTHTQARYVLPPVIKRFRSRYPGVTLELHQGTSEQIADMAAAQRIDFAIATSSQELFPELVLLPCYHWDRVVLVPAEHELARREGDMTLATLAEYPLVTYVFSSTGQSSFKTAFAEQGLTPKVVFTARDADVIKTYVRIGMGVGVVASMARECGEDLVALEAAGLFPRCTTWLGFRRGTVMRRYMYDFIELFASHLDAGLVDRAAGAATQTEVDALMSELPLPLRNGCTESVA